MITTGTTAASYPCPRCGMPILSNQTHLCSYGGSTLSFNLRSETGFSKVLKAKIDFYIRHIADLEEEIESLEKLVVEERSILAVLDELLAEYHKPDTFASS